MLKFSPPAWGWSVPHQGAENLAEVLPTRVGMVRNIRAGGQAERCSPHPRGDGPQTRSEIKALRQFSPPAWGWSDVVDKLAEIRAVLPTRVGMVRCPFKIAEFFMGSPHPRGDGPTTVVTSD